ncbi:MAG: septum formation initiator family protein [Firmicutes bacterium]|nr:septum formation initiator family protein [Bacillota bacterium]
MKLEVRRMQPGTHRLFRQVANTRYRIWMRRLARLGVVAFCLLLCSSFARAGWELWELRHEEARLQLAVQVLREQNDALRAQIKYMQDEAYIQQAARQLGLVKPGEVLYFPARETPGSP